jgi:hypothetical protein
MQLGDRIQSLNQDGVVRDMNGRSVVIETDDGRTVHLPNAKVLDNPLVNSSTNSARRTEVHVQTPGTDDIDGAIEGILAAAAQASGVLAEPAPVAVVRSIDHDSITMVVRIWHEPTPDAGAAAVSEVIRLIHAAEQQHGRTATVFTPPAAAPAPPHHIGTSCQAVTAHRSDRWSDVWVGLDGPRRCSRQDDRQHGSAGQRPSTTRTPTLPRNSISNHVAGNVATKNNTSATSNTLNI